jgi:hypothetical protein
MREVELDHLDALVEPEESLIFFSWSAVPNLARPGPGEQPPLERDIEVPKRCCLVFMMLCY